MDSPQAVVRAAMVIRSGAVFVLVALLVVTTATIAHGEGSLGGLPFDRSVAQDGAAPKPGDVFWQFAPRGALADRRTETAFAIFIGARAEAIVAAAGLDPGRRLLYGIEEVRGFAAIDGSLAEADALLAAAGLRSPDGKGVELRERRRCRVWTPSDIEGEIDRLAVAAALGDALAAVMRDLGVEAQPCEVVADSDEADLFVWDFAHDVHVNQLPADFDAPGFLELTVELPGRVPGGTGGGPTPPSSGNGGFAAGVGESSRGAAAALLVATALLLAVGRALTVRGRAVRS